MKRFLGRDGRFNVVPKGYRQSLASHDFYHVFLSMSWTSFLCVAVMVYLGLNFLFAALYYACGPDALVGLSARAQQGEGRFWETFFFSVHTLATIGYGSVAPAKPMAHVLVTIEAFVGLMSVAIQTGLLFARFSRPTARILFSRVAVMNRRNGKPVFMFRMANERLNQVVNAEVKVIVTYNDTSEEGEVSRVSEDLKLVRDHSPFFAMTWTVIHIIDELSPLHALTAQDLLQKEAEIFVTFTGLDDVLTQTVHARYSYAPEDIVWDRRFKDILGRDAEHRLQIDLEAIHDVV